MNRFAIHALLSVPGVLLICGWQTDQLGVDPEKTVIWETGIWTFNLLITVLVLPVIARWARWSTLLRYRRAVGLWVFAYASAHFVSFLTFLLGWDITRLGEEVTERPYVLAGFSAWLILLTMAVTSTRRWMRSLGRWWKRLHTMVYVVLGLAAVHYLLMIRSDWAWPVTYAVCAVTLLAMRLVQRRQVIVRSN